MIYAKTLKLAKKEIYFIKGTFSIKKISNKRV